MSARMILSVMSSTQKLEAAKKQKVIDMSCHFCVCCTHFRMKKRVVFVQRHERRQTKAAPAYTLWPKLEKGESHWWEKYANWKIISQFRLLRGCSKWEKKEFYGVLHFTSSPFDDDDSATVYQCSTEKRKLNFRININNKGTHKNINIARVVEAISHFPIDSHT